MKHIFRWIGKEPTMEGSSSMVSNQHDKAKKGLEGTALDIPINRYANLKSATSDDDFTNVLAHIKSSKTPVSNRIPFVSNFSTSLHKSDSSVLSQNSLQAVINYGASWYVTASP